MILADGVVGQMMEKVVLPEQKPRRTDEEIRRQCPWAVTGKEGRGKRNVVTSLELDSAVMEKNNERFQRTYREIEKNEVRYEARYTEDAEYLIVAFGSIARICAKAIEDLRKEGVRVGLIRPVTLWPFPYEAVSDSVPVRHFGRMGGIVPNPQEIIDALRRDFIDKPANEEEKK